MNLEVTLKLGLDTSFDPDSIDVRIVEENSHLIKLEYRDYVYYMFRSDLSRLAHIFGSGALPVEINVKMKGEQ